MGDEARDRGDGNGHRGRGVSTRAPEGPSWRSGALARARRALAVALLPASILPVLAFGSGIVRAPEQLVRSVLQGLAGARR